MDSVEVSLVIVQSSLCREVLAADAARLLDAVDGHQVPAQAGVVAEGLAANGTHVRSSPSVGDVVVLNRKAFGMKLVHF